MGLVAVFAGVFDKVALPSTAG